MENYARKSCRAFPLEDKDNYRIVVLCFCCVSSCKSHVLRYESFGSCRGRGIISGGFEFFLVLLLCLFSFFTYMFSSLLSATDRLADALRSFTDLDVGIPNASTWHN